MTNPQKVSKLAESLIGKDFLEMDENESNLVLAPITLFDAQKEIIRLRGLVSDLANNRISETCKELLK